MTATKERKSIRPPRTMTKGELDEWCAWHDQWEQPATCRTCGSHFPIDYALIHVKVGCTGRRH